MEGWYCPKCNEFLNGNSVTYEENCDFCKHPVTWVEEEFVVLNKAEYDELLEYKNMYEDLCR